MRRAPPWQVPATRVRAVNDAPVRERGRFVLYWMTTARRSTWSHGLARAVELCARLDRPLVVLEALRVGYPHASDRLHRFVLDGMADNRAAFARTRALYLPYVEPAAGAGRGLLAALAAHAGVVVTDDYPAFFLPRMVAAAARRLPVRLEAVDGNGLLPVRSAERAFPTAHGFRRHLQRTLWQHLRDLPPADPLAATPLPEADDLPRGLRRRWPMADDRLLAGRGDDLATLPIDHAVGPVATRGGAAQAHARLDRFLAAGLADYATTRNQPRADATSGLAPYLHFGHVAAHEVFDRVARAERWAGPPLDADARGGRTGYWRMSASAEAFLDQLVTWRELGFNTCAFLPDHDRYESLPRWARDTLARHARDPRPTRYSPAALAAAGTHDPVWNAAQTQLVREGTIAGYLRMLWGKKILEWSASPRAALATMLHLNNTYALDGRDPNSYAGIFWVLGRYDRAFGPKRQIFGTVRYMSSANTARKLRLKEYLARYTP
jgi:deoxyribodipyrimidine photo-lyase